MQKREGQGAHEHDGDDDRPLFNRFDLASPSGADCGEYRIVYAKQSGLVSGTDRNFLIFEARLPNPTPSAGLTGCLPVADFWANLTIVGSVATRATLLRDFYFVGLGGGFTPPGMVNPALQDGGPDFECITNSVACAVSLA